MPAARNLFARSPGLKAERVDVGLHHVAERRVDHSMALDRRRARERGARDLHGVVPASVLRALVAGVLMYSMVFFGVWWAWVNFT